MPQDRLEASSFSPDIREFIRLLHIHMVRYLIIGGEAAIFYGHARLTGDVDFFYECSALNAERLYCALDDFWDRAIPGVENASELMKRGLILQFGRPPNRIDLINRIEGVTFEEAWPSRKEAALELDQESVPVYYLGLESLILNKRSVGRPKDLDDLAYLTKAAKRQQK